MARRPTRVIRGRTARTNVAGSNRRLRVGRMLLVVALVLTSAKLIQVQGFEASALSEQAVKQRLDRSVIPADRGSIMDRGGNVLAFSSEARQLYANPRLLNKELDEQRAKDPSKPTAAEYKQEIARFIAQELPGVISEQEVLDALFRDVGFTYFGPKIDPGKAREITEKYPQIGSEYQATREYPGGDLAANIIGAANWRKDEVPGKLRGQIGLESSMDSVLAGKDGQQVSDTALGSDLVIPGTRELEPAVPGSDVELTIDSDVQFMLQRELSDYAREAQAKSASAVVLDAKTGEVYGLANDKTFDPNVSWGEHTGNPAVTTPYEPGSVAKLITAAGAIETGVMKPDTVLQVPGSIKVADRTVGDAWPHGTVPMTFTGVMGKSSNVGTLMAAQQLGEQRWYDFARAFGLGQRTGVGLPGESAGVLPPPDQWSGSSFGNLPIGQGFSMTVLQMASMYQAIANDGVRMPPRIIAAETGPDGKRVERPRPQGVQVVSPETAHTVKDMLRSVVQNAPQPNRGTGPAAALPGFQVSGKTGTAQQYDPACKCYSNSKHWITFAGVFPADSPRFVIGLMLDRPAYGTQEGTSAAPLFNNIASFLAQRYQLPLSKEESPVQVLQLPVP